MEGEGGKSMMSTESLDQIMMGGGSPTATQSIVTLERGKRVSTPTGALNKTGGEPIMPPVNTKTTCKLNSYN